jgi:flagellar assembly protein FliH
VRGAFSEQDVQRYTPVELGCFDASPSSVQDKVEAEEASQSAEHGEDQGEEDTSEGSHDPSPSKPPAPSIEEILVFAQQQAESVLVLAQQEAEQLRQTAYAEGLASGREEGREQAKQELLPALIAFAQAGQSLIVLEDQLIERTTPNLVRFALEIAEKVVGKAVEEDPHIVASVLELARAELPQARSVRLYLHPLDHQALAECRPDLVRIGEKGGRTVEVVPAEDIERGGCRVETEMGVVDATIPVQLEEIRRQMLD